MLNTIHSYRESLYALLITPSYLSPVNTVEDMINSESQFIAPGGTSVVILLKIDPRPGVRKLFEMHLPVSFEGGSYNATIRNGFLKISYLIMSPHDHLQIAE